MSVQELVGRMLIVCSLEMAILEVPLVALGARTVLITGLARDHVVHPSIIGIT